MGLPPYNWWSENIVFNALNLQRLTIYYRQVGVALSPGTRVAPPGNHSGTLSLQPILTGAAFDDVILSVITTVISTEAGVFDNAGRAVLDFLIPNINSFKDPRWSHGLVKIRSTSPNTATSLSLVFSVACFRTRTTKPLPIASTSPALLRRKGTTGTALLGPGTSLISSRSSKVLASHLLFYKWAEVRWTLRHSSIARRHGQPPFSEYDLD